MKLTDYFDEDRPDDATLDRWAYEHELPIERLTGVDKPWHSHDSYSIFETPWEDIPLLCDDFDIGRGRPCGLVGLPGSGKNDVAQAFALAVATGRDAFESYPVQQGATIHLTWDMGARGTALRYRCLANGMGVDPGELDSNLLLCAHPEVNLTTLDAVGIFEKRLAGFALCILDNARAATGNADENESVFGNYLSLLGRAAQRTGTTVLYLHHSRKGGGAGLDVIRGSGAIVGASGSIWVIDGLDGPRELKHIRCHEMTHELQPPFWMVREECPGASRAFDIGTHVPYRMVAHESKPPSGEDALAGSRAVLEAIGECPGAGTAGLQTELRIKRATLVQLLGALVESGEIEDRGDSRGHRYYCK